MARPIKETPVLTGEYARRFDESLKENESKTVSTEEYNETMNSYRRFKVVEPAIND